MLYLLTCYQHLYHNMIHLFIKMNRIKEILGEKGWTVKKLSEKIDKSRTITSGYCNNRRQPTLIILREIADVLEVDVRQLLLPTKNELRVLYIKSNEKNYERIGELRYPKESH